MSADVETVVIGAGVAGLAIARALALAGHEVMVLEQHDAIGTETSSRNSEVIHAGLYYPPGSLKARLCVDGKERLYRFAAENGVTVSRCGKLLVATHGDEIAKLEAIAETARKNGVADLIRLTPEEAAKREPEVACVAAYLSPSTGVIDSHGTMQALEGHIASRGGSVVLNTCVAGLSRIPDGNFALETVSAGEAGTLTSRNLVLAAGLHATRLGRMLETGAYRAPETFYAKGHYYALTGKVPFRHLVYPMPHGGGLGVHVTLDVGGQAKFGPDIEWKDAISYDFEDRDGRRRAAFEREIRRYWPGLPDNALAPGYVGVRPKLTRAGEPAADFAIHGEAQHGVPRLVALYGIESPGLTASLAIGECVARMVG